MTIKCTVCKRRSAVYKRTYSGDLLCPICLERAVIRGVRRSLGEAGILLPRHTILLPITFSNPLGSLVLSHVLPKVERRFGSQVIVGIPEELVDVVDVLPENLKYHIIEIDGTPTRTREDPIFCWRFDRRWSLLTARLVNANAIILPLSRTDLNLLALHALISGKPEALSEALPLINWTNPPIISGLSRLEGEIVAAYAAVKNIDAPKGCCPDLSLSKSLFYSVAGRRPELEFSSFKSLRLLLEGARRLSKCKYCGGFTREGEVCEYCRNSLNVIVRR
jgi:hypothetical protein